MLPVMLGGDLDVTIRVSVRDRDRGRVRVRVRARIRGSASIKLRLQGHDIADGDMLSEECCDDGEEGNVNHDHACEH